MRRGGAAKALAYDRFSDLLDAGFMFVGLETALGGFWRFGYMSWLGGTLMVLCGGG